MYRSQASIRQSEQHSKDHPSKSRQPGQQQPISPAQAATDKCERLLAYRERSSGELRKRLLEAGFSAAITESTVARYVAAGLVDDERFCRLFIESKRGQSWGMQRIIRSLYSYGIQVTDYPEVLQAFSDEADELERAMAALNSYRGRAKDAYTGRFRYLVAKGFSPGVVRQALHDWVGQQNG